MHIWYQYCNIKLCYRIGKFSDAQSSYFWLKLDPYQSWVSKMNTFLLPLNGRTLLDKHILSYFLSSGELFFPNLFSHICQFDFILCVKAAQYRSNGVTMAWTNNLKRSPLSRSALLSHAETWIGMDLVGAARKTILSWQL